MSASNINVGLGIGMSGETTVPDQIFRAQQQQDLTQAKAARKQSDEEEKQLEQIKQKLVFDKTVVDPLESEKLSREAQNRLLEIVRAKQQNPSSYLNIAYEKFSEYRDLVNQSLGKSAMLKKFREKTMKVSPNEYMSTSVKKARDLMNSSRTTEEWMSKLQESGVESDDYFTYDPSTGNFDFTIPPAFDPVKEVRQVYNDKQTNPLALVKSAEKLSTGKTITKFTTKTGVPRTQKEASAIYDQELQRRISAGESIAGMPTPISGETIANQYLSVPEKLTQYMDKFPETKNMSQVERVEHFLKNFYDPYSPYKETPRYIDEKGQVVNVSIGGEEPASEFLFVKDSGTFAGTDIPYKGLMAVAKDGKYKTNAIVLNDVLDLRTKKELETKQLSVQGKDIGFTFGQVYVVPVVKEGGKKRLVTQSEIESGRISPTYEVRAELNFSNLEGTGPLIETLTKSTTLWPIDKVKSMLYTQGLREKQITALNVQLKKAKDVANELNSKVK
jgi:hypothetical protein